jgi:hypothetical protein
MDYTAVVSALTLSELEELSDAVRERLVVLTEQGTKNVRLSLYEQELIANGCKVQAACEVRRRLQIPLQKAKQLVNSHVWSDGNA